MAHEITLQQAAQKAEQAETVLQLLKFYPNSLTESEIEALAFLLSSLVGNASAWLAEEQARQEAENDQR
jgi:hypothetical protein